MEKSRRRKIRYLLIIILPALFLTFLSKWAMKVQWILEYEQHSIVYPTEFKRWLNEKIFPGFFYDENFIAENFLIVNVTHDQELTSSDQTTNEAGTPITNREKLDSLLTFLYRNEDLFNMIVCDLDFHSASLKPGADRSLNEIIGKLRTDHRIIFAAEYRSGEEYPGTVLDEIDTEYCGQVNKESAQGVFFKYRLAMENPHLKSLPLLMFEKINKIELLREGPGLIKYRDSTGKTYRMYNSFIPEMLFDIDYFDKFEDRDLDSSKALCDLGTIVNNSTDIALRSLLFTKNKKPKTIFIGAVSHDQADMHYTFYGMLDGPIVLLNIYYDLINGTNQLNYLQILISFLTFYFICYSLFLRPKKHVNKPFTPWGHIKELINERRHFFILVVLTFVLNLFFRQSTNLIILLVLIEVVRGIVVISRNYKLVKVSNTSNR